MTDVPALDHSVVLWSVPPDHRAGRPLLVLIHGYGADERDLFSLARHLPDEFVVAAVRAPLTLPWPSPGYSWYPIEGMGGRSSQATTDAASGFLAWLDAAAGDAPLIGLLGFSQGGAIAIQALRMEPERFAFVINLSGYATPGPLPTDAALAAVRPAVFWGRGTHDDVIPSALVEHTTAWLPKHVDLSGRVYPGLGHSISEQELADVQTFLAKQLEAGSA